MPDLLDTDVLLSKQQAADLIGVDPATIARKIVSGELPAYKIGNARVLVRIKRSDLLALLQPYHPKR